MIPRVHRYDPVGTRGHTGRRVSDRPSRMERDALGATTERPVRRVRGERSEGEPPQPRSGPAGRIGVKANYRTPRKRRSGTRRRRQRSVRARLKPRRATERARPVEARLTSTEGVGRAVRAVENISRPGPNRVPRVLAHPIDEWLLREWVLGRSDSRLPDSRLRACLRDVHTTWRSSPDGPRSPGVSFTSTALGSQL
jgi:hypothetical protein